MPWSAFPFGNVDKVVKRVTQAAHGFEAGSVVILSGATYVNSKADAPANCAGTLMVSNKIDNDTFEVCSNGYVVDLTKQDPYTPGTTYYVSENTAGELTDTPPVHVGEVRLPCFFADTATSGWFIGGSGNLITSGTIFSDIFVSTNTLLAVNNNYIVNGGANVILTLPSVYVDGDTIPIQVINDVQTTVTANAGDFIEVVDLSSSAGGTLTLQQTGGVYRGSVILKCTTPLLIWQVVGGMGQWLPA